MSVRDLTLAEVSSVSGGDLYRFDSQNRISDGSKTCHYTNLTKMTSHSYNAGKGASAYCVPGQTRVLRGGGMTTSSPNVGHTFKSINKPGSGLSGLIDAVLEFFSKKDT